MLALAVILLVVLGFLGGLAVIAMVLDRWNDRKNYLEPKADPREVLEMRLAKGEIGEAEFIRLSDLLAYGSTLELPG